MSEALTVTERRQSAHPARPGVTSETLSRYLVPLRVGDPLGLGVARPPAPPDPDVYDRAEEDEHYARSALTEEQRAVLDKTIENEGYMSVDAVRRFICDNASATLTESSGLDPEMMMLIDARTNYKIFLTEGNVYTREELYDHFPFHELNTQPEAVFTQQEIGLFPAGQHSMNPDELNYVARDVGDESVEFITIEDMVGLATRKDHKMKRALLRAVKTKVYIGKEPWEDFKAMQQLMRGAVRMARAGHAAGGSAAGIFATLMGGGAASAPKLITDSETLALERRAREEADAKRESELKAREDDLRRREEEIQQRIDKDIARLEKMFASKGLSAHQSPVKPPPISAKAGPVPTDVAAPVEAAVLAKATAAPAKAAAPVEATITPTKVAAPAKATVAPTKAATPVKATVAPVKAAAPVKATIAPVKATVVPVKAAAAPVKAAAAPVKAAAAPVKAAAAPVKATVTPVKAAAIPVKTTTPTKTTTTPAKTLSKIPSKLSAKPTLSVAAPPPSAKVDYSALFAEMFPDDDSVPT